VLLVVEEVNQSEQVLAVQVRAIGLNVSKQLNLIYTLIEVVFVILDDLHTHHLLCVDVIALDSFRESSTAQVLYYLVSASHNTVDHNREVFGLFKASLLSVENHSEVVAVVNYTVELSWIEFIV